MLPVNNFNNCLFCQQDIIDGHWFIFAGCKDNTPVNLAQAFIRLFRYQNQIVLFQMRKCHLIALILLWSAGGFTQQKPIYTQYVLNNYIINPAITGIENYTDVKISHRNQWTGIDGAPVTTYLSVQGPIGKKDYKTNATSFDVTGENPRGRSYVDEYTASAPHHGLGGIIITDKTGYLTRWGGYVTYAYHKGLSSRTTLSAGFLAGVTSVSLDASKIVWGAPGTEESLEFAYDNGLISKLRPEIGAGLWLYGADFYAGVSVLNIVPGKKSFIKDARYYDDFVPHFFTTAGYKFFLNDDLTLLPSVMLQYVQPLPLQIYTNAKLQYQDKLWLGTSYRFGDELGGFAAMAGVNISNTFNIGYSYDVSTSSLRTYSRNTHEFIVGFLLGNRYGDFCPRNVW
jgi:type IX secretion system PorP/SprF family membrane protein